MKPAQRTELSLVAPQAKASRNLLVWHNEPVQLSGFVQTGEIDDDAPAVEPDYRTPEEIEEDNRYSMQEIDDDERRHELAREQGR